MSLVAPTESNPDAGQRVLRPVEYGGDARFRLATTLAALFLPRPATGDDFRITRMLRRQSLVSAPAVIASLRRPAAQAAADDVGFAAAAAQAFEAGIPLRFEGLFAGEARRRISLPGYPFQRRRFWIDTTPE